MWGSNYSFRTFSEASALHFHPKTWPPLLLSLSRVLQHDPHPPSPMIRPHQSLDVSSVQAAQSNTVRFVATSHELSSPLESRLTAVIWRDCGEKADACSGSALFTQTSSEQDSFCF